MQTPSPKRPQAPSGDGVGEHTGISIEVWSDIVCPWCYIGKRRLEKALSLFGHRDLVALTWRSYQLDPSSPKTATESTRVMLARKYGVPPEEADTMQARVAGVAAQEGLAYRLDATRSENSLDAHRLLHLAHQYGLQDALKERLFAAYFTEGASIGDTATLQRLAEETGLDSRKVATVLGGEDYMDAVRADQQQAARLGIQGVPFFVVTGRSGPYGLSGAQPAELMLRVLNKAMEAADEAG